MALHATREHCVPVGWRTYDVGALQRHPTTQGAAVTDIDDALQALKAEGFNHHEAVKALEVLTEAGFMVIRPQTMLTEIVEKALLEAQ